MSDQTDDLLKQAPWVVVNHDADCEYVGSICDEPCTCGAFERACIEAGGRIGRLAASLRASREQVVASEGRLDRAEAKVVELERTVLDIENREAAVCPEDVGFEEFIRTLTRQLAESQATVARLTAERDARLGSDSEDPTHG